MSTADYYDANAAEFLAQTRDVDMGQHYARFLRHIPAGGKLIDAGSGSGRDARWFKEHGYKVEAFDASPAMVEATRRWADVPTHLLRFEDFLWHQQVDGIWACASLLHVSRSTLPGVLQRLARALKPGGAIYCSFKYGEEERTILGRYFNDMTEATLKQNLASTDLIMSHTEVTSDLRPGRSDEHWLNALLIS